MLGNIYFIKNSLRLYIGSTIRDISDRFKEHLRDVSKYPNFKLYEAMKEYGFDNFYILLIEQIEVDDIKQLRQHEGQYIRLIESSLNSNIAGRTMKQYQIDNYEELQIYRRNYYRTYRTSNYQSLKL